MYILAYMSLYLSLYLYIFQKQMSVTQTHVKMEEHAKICLTTSIVLVFLVGKEKHVESVRKMCRTYKSRNHKDCDF